jgi:hypothetical protein
MQKKNAPLRAKVVQGLGAMNKLARTASLLFLSLCAARSVAAEDCRHARPLAEMQLVVGDTWFVHTGADRRLSCCKGSNVSLWLHEGCDDDEGKHEAAVPCNKHMSSVLHALGGQLYLRARGDGVVYAPLHDECTGVVCLAPPPPRL